MFDNLVESKPQKKALKDRLPSAFMSVVFHGAVIYAAIMVTMQATQVATNTAADTTMMYVQPEKQEKQPEPPKIATINPPPKGFQNITAPVNIPTTIPPVDLNQHFNPKDYSGVGVEGGVANGIVGGTGPVDLNQIFTSGVVDEPPMMLSRGPMNYPPLLKDAGIEGAVTLKFVVNPDGHVDPSSIQILSSTNKAFEKPARELIQQSIFRPGRMQGQAVHVLVQTTVNFTLQKGS